MSDTEVRDVVGAHVASYVPRHVPLQVWASVQSAVRAAALASTSTPPTVKVALPSLAAFAQWLHLEGDEVTVVRLADRSAIERYTQVGMPGASEATRATRRATLRRLAERLDPDPQPAPEQIGYRRARAPYAQQEVARFLAHAQVQPTQARRQSLGAILALGLGAGLHGQDLAWVRGADVRSSSDVVAVTVCGGPKPRRVVVLDEYADLVARSAHRTRGGDLLIGGFTLGRVNVTAATLDRMITDRSIPRVIPTRLRATWLVRHLNLRTPYKILLPAAGLESSRTLDDLLRYADPLDTDEATRLLRGAIGGLVVS